MARAKTATKAATAPAKQPPPMTLEYLDPEKITARNIRASAPSQRLIDSVAEFTVLQPIGVLRTETGELVLRFGDRRRLAAAACGQQVPAIVVDGTTGTPADEIERIFTQLAENDGREDLTAADHAAAIEALFEYGADEATVIRKTGRGKTELAAARKVAASEAARTLAAQYPLDLGQLAAVAEFEGDGQAMSQLLEAAEEGTGEFAHTLQYVRDERDEQATVAEAAKEWEAKGYTAAAKWPPYDHQFYSLAGPDGQQLTGETHAGCPGRAVYLRAQPDRNTDDAGTRKWQVQATEFCADPKANGHPRLRTDSATGARSAQLAGEEATEERRRVIAGNKAWRSAETVRRGWLREFLARPKPPEGGLLFTLLAFAASDSRLRYAMEHRSGGRWALARDLLGIPKVEGGWYAPPEVHTAMAQASPARAQVIALGLVLGSCEQATDVSSWRDPTGDTAAYLEALAGWGYQLSDIEQQLVDSARAKAAERAAVITQDDADAAAHGDPDEDDPDGPGEPGGGIEDEPPEDEGPPF